MTGWLAALTLLAAACGGEPLLDNVGDLSERVVHGDRVTTTSPEVVGVGPEPLPLKRTTEVEWFNSGLSQTQGVEPAIVLNRVWERSEGINRFVQATPHEIILSVPNVRFPSVLPEEVESITSQLVFDLASGILDPADTAAFGFWTTTPYTVGREAGQVAVLRVGQATAAFEADPFSYQVSTVDDGISIVWFVGEYRYELFCRLGIPEDVCRAMADTAEPLSQLAPVEGPVEVADA